MSGLLSGVAYKYLLKRDWTACLNAIIEGCQVARKQSQVGGEGVDRSCVLRACIAVDEGLA